MKKNIWIFLFGIFILTIGTVTYFKMNHKEEILKQMSGVVLSMNDEYVIVEDSNNVMYKFKVEDFIVEVGEEVVIKYTGLLDSNKDVQDIQVKDYIRSEKKSVAPEENELGIFKDYYSFAKKKLDIMTLDEKIAQILLVRYPASNAVNTVKEKQFGGYIFFATDFKDKTKAEVKSMIKDVQNVSKIPLLTAVDEEGGSVVRISSNSKLVSTPFKSPSELYKAGGMDAIRNDTLDKSTVLANLGINLNLAPVIDVTKNPSDYMYSRSLQEDTETTSEYAKTVITASKNGTVSYTLKHFPGYGNNADTHTGSSTDSRTYESILKNDLPPFEAGINAGAEAVLVNHNIVTNIDSSNPASLSIPIHNILRDDLNFTGVIITDELSMGAMDGLSNIYVKAIEAGNDLLIVTDYDSAIDEIKKAIDDGSLSEDVINDRALQVLAWKYYKGMIYENQK